MRSLRIVKANPDIDDPFSLETVGDLVQVNCPLLQRSPQPFDKDIIQIATSSIHRYFNFGFGQSRNPTRASILAALKPFKVSSGDLNPIDLFVAAGDDVKDLTRNVSFNTPDCLEFGMAR
jgi:hypothetical protein